MPTTDLWPRLRQRFACVAALGGIAALAACGGGGDASPDAPSSEPADSEQRAQALATSTWTKIASEGQSFTVSGVRTVRYGAGSSWVQKQVSGTGQCTNAFFGRDPLRGVVKRCEVLTTTSSPAPAPAPAPSSSADCGLSNFSADALRLINEFRAAPRSCGSAGSFAAAAPLAWNDQLAQAAAGHSTDMAIRNYFSHTSLDGRTMADRINATGYLWLAIGENIAAGYASVPSVVAAWQASPGHCANLMNPSYTQMGLACAPRASGSTYSHYWTLDLGKPR